MIEPIRGFPGYGITKNGDVWSMRRSNYCRKLKPGIVSGGYPAVGLCDGKKGWTKTIHRLLGQAFIDNPNNKPYVLHRDDDPLNYALDNLYWGNNSDNQRDALRHGNQPGTLVKGEDVNFAKLTEKIVRRIKFLLSRGVKQKCLAARYKVDPSAISRIKIGANWKHIINST